MTYTAEDWPAVNDLLPCEYCGRLAEAPEDHADTCRESESEEPRP